MANLTITIDDELLKRAQRRALELNTSVSALLREYLEAFAGGRSISRRGAEPVHGHRSGSQQQQRRQGPRRWRLC